MVEDRIGYRYAKSVFDLAKEKGQLDGVNDDMTLIHDTYEASRELKLLLDSPIISTDKKTAVLTSLFSSRFSSEISRHLMDILLRKGREKFIIYVADAFTELYDREKHISRGVLTTAVELSTAEVEEIRLAMEKRLGESFFMDVQVDPELIGGFVLRVGDQLFDGSVSTSLRELKQEFSKNSYIRKY